uniref:Tubby C-terminal domain-containing protein n=2 Tax=Fabrea salina TaxID=342563 RepID=A0A7S3IBE3_9CILI|mmetsp:Transcript_1774/g.2860  ORF Transcript_1774/g.2860 Transcript_1774/m.2860 type:complete len:503 (+) Transcript_1774:12-1520(+)
MFGDREFLDDSESSIEIEDSDTDSNFQEDRGSNPFSRTLTETPFEKRGSLPNSTLGQMRAKMQQQRSSFNRSGTINLSSTIEFKPSVLRSNIDSIIDSKVVLNGRDLHQTKEFRNLAGGFGYDPTKTVEEKLPEALSPTRTIFRTEDEESTQSQSDNNVKPQRTEVEIQHPQTCKNPKSSFGGFFPEDAPKVKFAYQDDFQQSPIERNETEFTPEETNFAPTVPVESQEETKETKDTQINMREAYFLIKQEMSDMFKFVNSPLRKNIKLECTIRRDRKGFGRLYPKYYLHLSDGWSFILGAKKRPGKKTPNFLLSMSKEELSVKSDFYLGKLRGNFLGSKYFIYDKGLNPKSKYANVNNTRQELGVMLYEGNGGNSGPRKMRVIIPAVNTDQESVVWKPVFKEQSILENYNAKNYSGMFAFYNKPPVWNDKAKAFVLDFKGRVSMASIRNFQLVDDKNEDNTYIQFGRIGENHFNLDFKWPFSPLQAFSIALSSLDNHLVCD